jgi:hypothetical protein
MGIICVKIAFFTRMVDKRIVTLRSDYSTLQEYFDHTGATI